MECMPVNYHVHGLSILYEMLETMVLLLSTIYFFPGYKIENNII